MAAQYWFREEKRQHADSDVVPLLLAAGIALGLVAFLTGVASLIDWVTVRKRLALAVKVVITATVVWAVISPNSNIGGWIFWLGAAYIFWTSESKPANPANIRASSRSRAAERADIGRPDYEDAGDADDGE